MTIPPDNPYINFDFDWSPPDAWARMYRHFGLSVIPAWAPREGTGSYKRPLLSQWRDLQNQPVSDAMFATWYAPNGAHSSRANMGLITGRCSGAFVLDLDIHSNPQAHLWWKALIEVENAGLELETPTQRTGGGGLQMLFRYPAHWTPPTNRTGIGVDIRGQGGFAVLPPSHHESGRDYAWLPGRGPWEIEILEAPQWLLDEIDQLVIEHGGDREKIHPKTGDVSSLVGPIAPGSDYTPFGRHQDGRESYMRDAVWAAVINWHRECPIMPPAFQWEARARQEFEVYERNVVSRLSGDKSAGLEREGRGFKEFWSKWRTAMRRWEGKIREEAAKPAPAKPFMPHAPFVETTAKAEGQ